MKAAIIELAGTVFLVEQTVCENIFLTIST